MRVVHRFTRVRDQRMWFARVELSAEPAAAWAVELAPGSDTAHYEAAVRLGVQRAIASHAERGGAPCRIVVERLVWTVVDTTEDAVICAAAVATWRALGHDEAAAIFGYEAGVWSVGFAPLA